MQTKHFTSQQFNEDAEGARRAAQEGPVVITDHGRPTYVLLSIEDYQRLVSKQIDMVRLMGLPAGVEDIELELPARREILGHADFDA